MSVQWCVLLVLYYWNQEDLRRVWIRLDLQAKSCNLLNAHSILAVTQHLLSAAVIQAGLLDGYLSVCKGAEGWSVPEDVGRKAQMKRTLRALNYYNGL